MDVLSAFVPTLPVLLVVFSAPLFHMFLVAGQAVARLIRGAEYEYET